MSLTAQKSSQLESLLTDLADERLNADGRVALEELLKSEPEARDQYIRFMAFCSDLHDTAAMTLSAEDEKGDRSNLCEAPSGPFRQIGPVPFFVARGQRRWWPLWAAVVATALTAAIVVFTVWWPETRVAVSSSDGGSLLGRLEGLTGAVGISNGENSYSQAAAGQEIRSGQTVVTNGSDAHVAIRLQDDSELMLSGDSRLAFPREDSERVNVERGNLIADVQPRPADRPLVICTPEANVEVLGTRLSVSCEPEKTRVAVLEGEIRITRLSDQREVQLVPGQATEVSPEADLRPTPIQAAPDHWSLDFNDGLPHGWQTGQLVFDELPDGSNAAVRTGGVVENGRRRYQIRSHNAWSDGLFSLHDDSWIHIRYRVEKPGTFLLYVVCRQHDFGQPVATVLTTGNLRQKEAKQWHTLTLALNQLHRAKTKDTVPPDGQLVAFLLVFDSPEHNPGLTVDRIWVTRGQPAKPRSPMDIYDDRMDGSVD